MDSPLDGISPATTRQLSRVEEVLLFAEGLSVVLIALFRGSQIGENILSWVRNYRARQSGTVPAQAAQTPAPATPHPASGVPGMPGTPAAATITVPGAATITVHQNPQAHAFGIGPNDEATSAITSGKADTGPDIAEAEIRGLLQAMEHRVRSLLTQGQRDFMRKVVCAIKDPEKQVHFWIDLALRQSDEAFMDRMYTIGIVYDSPIAAAIGRGITASTALAHHLADPVRDRLQQSIEARLNRP